MRADAKNTIKSNRPDCFVFLLTTRFTDPYGGGEEALQSLRKASEPQECSDEDTEGMQSCL